MREILSGVVNQLTKDNRKTFMIESTGYLKYWMEDEKVSSNLKSEFQELYSRGRLEIAN